MVLDRWIFGRNQAPADKIFPGLMDGLTKTIYEDKRDQSKQSCTDQDKVAFSYTNE